MLDRLEKAGLLQRVADPSDRRVRAVELTETGRERIDRAIEVRFREAELALAGLAPEERDGLASLLRKLIITIDSADLP